MAVTESWIPPARLPQLLIKPLGEDGQHVVKDPREGSYFNLPPQESFLLLQLDGRQSAGVICASFEKRFGDALGPNDVEDFVALVSQRGFLEAAPGAAPVEPAAPAPKPALSPKKLATKVLFWRKSVFDPDRLFNWLEPKIAFCWSALFFWCSLATIAAAALLFFNNRAEFAEYLPEILTWETILLGWVILCVVTTGHEFAHGLTCKHYGGEVHEVGFMLMFFMPCFYCNVSDAWLIKERSKRLWVTAAGSYFDLCLWALATMVWRVTLPYSLPYHVAWIVMSICGGRVFINVNPLVKLDGYYMLSDWLEIPNLSKRAQDYFSAHARWLLWGAARPELQPRGKVLMTYGVLSWSFAIFYVSLMLIAMHRLFLSSLGVFGILVVLGLAWIVLPGLVGDIFSNEVTMMILHRWKRTAIWVSVAIGLIVASFLIQIDDWVGGAFKTRATVKAEIRAPVGGFLHLAYLDEGHQVAPGEQVAMLDIPDLSSKIAQKVAEQKEVEAKLRSLEGGARREEIDVQRQKVERAKEWCKLAKADLARKGVAFKEEIARIEEQITQNRTQLEFHQGVLDRAKRLVDKKSIPFDQYQEAQKQVLLTQAQLLQSQALKRERQAVGVLDAETEQAKREKDLADAAAALRLLEKGVPEEADIEKTKLARIREERSYLEKQQERLKIMSPIRGVVVTPRLREKIGQYFKEGDLICEIEDPTSMDIEIPLEEIELARVSTGMSVELKPRSQPFQTVKATVTRIAPQATAGKVQSTVNVCCTPENGAAALLTNTTGYARIYTDHSSIAGYLAHRTWRYFRTEIWW